MSIEPEYIGDGVYASFDGWMIWLRTKRDEGWHEIALEPQVFKALTDYANRIWPQTERVIHDYD